MVPASPIKTHRERKMEGASSRLDDLPKAPLFPELLIEILCRQTLTAWFHTGLYHGRVIQIKLMTRFAVQSPSVCWRVFRQDCVTVVYLQIINHVLLIQYATYHGWPSSNPYRGSINKYCKTQFYQVNIVYSWIVWFWVCFPMYCSILSIFYVFFYDFEAFT